MSTFYAQREVIRAVTEDVIEDSTLRERINGLLERARGLATKRNRLIHSRWKHTFLQRQGQQYRVVFRLYIPTNPSLLGPESPTLLRDMKGKLTFFIDDLKRCETEFSSLTEDVSATLSPVGEALGVSPHIEIPAEEVLELKILTNPPSDHPQENS